MSNTFSSLVRLGGDPEIRVIPSGKSVLNFNAASTTGFGDKKQTMWIRITYWNNPEKLASFLAKGDLCYVSGELSMREYESNGQTKISLELNAHAIDLVGSKKDGGQQSQQPQAQQQTSKPQEEFDDDIPF